MFHILEHEEAASVAAPAPPSLWPGANDCLMHECTRAVTPDRKPGTRVDIMTSCLRLMSNDVVLTASVAVQRGETDVQLCPRRAANR